jgi:hypothetical protein
MSIPANDLCIIPGYLVYASCVPNASPVSSHTILLQYQMVNTTLRKWKERSHKKEGRKVNTLCILRQDLGKILPTELPNSTPWFNRDIK